MTPAARVQTAIELLDAIIAAARDQGAAADTLIARAFAERRYAGSKDRRAIRDLVYDAIRLCGERPESGRAAMLALARARPEMLSLFDGVLRFSPAPLVPGEPVAGTGTAPAWLVQALTASDIGIGEQAALLDRAPLDLRVNRLKTDMDAARAAFPDAEPLAWAPDALRLSEEVRVEQMPLFQNGGIEVQDAGSQAVTRAAAGAPGMTVVDLCAGAGGKTLTLAAAMENRGSILACDVDRARLSRLAPRAERAGVTIASTRLLDPGRENAALADVEGQADVVLIDAPCSGTGTWRRNPEARWRLTEDRLGRLTALQARLVDVGAALVRPGGALVYIVCSLLDAEGRDQAEAFLARSGWQAEPLADALGTGTARGPGLRLTPARDSTDGFFVARMVRPC